MNEVVATSAQASPATHLLYGVRRVCAAWCIPRATFYAQRRRGATIPPATVATTPRVRRGPQPTVGDERLLQLIRQDLARSPFSAEGHRKVWARLRYGQGIAVGKNRILRLMREHHLLSPARVAQTPPAAHNGAIVTNAPNVMWATDGFRVFTREDGWVWGFIVIEHWNAECLGIHVCKHGSRFNAVEPLGQALLRIYGSLDRDVARGLSLRLDHGSQFLANHYQQQLRFWGITPSFAFLSQPQTNGVAERFIRTLKEQAIYGGSYNTVEDLRAALSAFVDRYNREWLIAKLGHRSHLQACNDYATLPAA